MIDPAALISDTADGPFRVDRSLFTDPAIFDLEMRHIFERSWVFLGMESQVAKPGDMLTTWLGRQPVLVTRNVDGKLSALLNSCRHKGARLVQTEHAHASLIVCPYHAWTYALDGQLRGIKDRASGCYAKSFADESHDLLALAQVDSYRGMIFGTLDPDERPLSEHLGETRPLIDLIMDQGEHGMELVPGRTAYMFDGNWKLQVENGMDPYHLTSTHGSFIHIVAQRTAAVTAMAAIKSRDFRETVTANGGAFGFEHGHGAVWIDNHTPEQKPINLTIDALRDRVGIARAQWMLNFRNLVLFPNVQLADSESLLLRVIRPRSVDRTEMRLYCLAPIGEPAAARTMRLRQHEDFFNASGLATPDDSAMYEECQIGFAAAGDCLQGYDRGIGATTRTPDEAAISLGIRPCENVSGPFKIQSELQYRPFYREWRRRMSEGLSRDSTAAAEAAE